MQEEQFEVRLARQERHFVKVYNDFLHTTLLTCEEKLSYIALKSFIGYGHDEGGAYPSMETLCKITSMSKPRVIKAINGLVDKGVVKKTRRGATKTNLYTLFDNGEIWQASTVQEMQEATENRLPYSSEALIEELRRRGDLPGEQEQKKPPLVAPRDGHSTKSMQSDCSQPQAQSQARFSREAVETLFDYEIIIADGRVAKPDVEAVFDILCDTLNTSRATIKILGEDKPTEVVIGKLMKLTYNEIEYAINKFNSVTERIVNPGAYMLSILYRAREQMTLDTSNQYRHNSA